MSSRNRVYVFIFIVFIFYILHKLYFGYGVAGYLYNFYWFHTHKNYYVQSDMNEFPIFLWRIDKQDENHTIFSSFIVDNNTISASLESKKIAPSEFMKNYCHGTFFKEKIDNNPFYICNNENERDLKSFALVPIQNNTLFIYGYSPDYAWLYNRLIHYLIYK